MPYYNTKKRKRLRLTIIFILLLASCTNFSEQTKKFPAFKKSNASLNVTYHELLTKIDYTTFRTLYENKWPLAFYIYQKGCHYVNLLEPVLYDYLQTTNLLLFTFDYEETDFYLLCENYGTLLDFKGTPAFYFWQKDYFHKTVTGIKEIKTFSEMTATFAKLIEFHNTTLSFNSDELYLDAQSITVSLNLADTNAVNFVGAYLLPYVKSHNTLYLNSHHEDFLSFYFSDTKETLVYTSTKAAEIKRRINHYYT